VSRDNCLRNGRKICSHPIRTQCCHFRATLSELYVRYKSIRGLQPDTETETLFIKPLYSLKSLTLSQLLRVNSQPWTLHVLML